jgi:hypothetical protein
MITDICSLGDTSKEKRVKVKIDEEEMVVIIKY